LTTRIADLEDLGLTNPFVTCNISLIKGVCETRVICLSIERVDFVRTMPMNMLEEFNSKSTIFLTTTTELQDRWLQIRNWEHHKRDVVKGIKKDSDHFKLMKKIQLQKDANKI
jgi:hypothetical protein